MRNIAIVALFCCALSVDGADTITAPAVPASSIGGSEIEISLNAYAAMKCAVQELRQSVASKAPSAKAIVIFNKTDFATLEMFDFYNTLFDQQTKKYEKLASGEISANLVPVDPIGALNNALTLLSLVHGAVDIKGKEITVSEFALHAELSKAFNASDKFKVISTSNFWNKPGGVGDFTTKLNNLLALRNAPAKKVDNDAETKRNAEAKKKIDDETDAFLAALFKSPELYGSIIRMDTIRQALADQNTYVLSVAWAVAGGNSLLTKNVFTGTKMYAKGGAVVAYELKNNKGETVDQGVVSSELPYHKVDIKER